MHLFEYFNSSCQGFCKNCHLGREVLWNHVQVSFGEYHVISKNAIVRINPQNGAAVAVSHTGAAAEITFPAVTIDLTHYFFAIKLPRSGHNLAHKFMSRNPLKRHISPGNFKIGIADGRIQYPDQHFILTRFWYRQFRQF